jgi:Ca2+-transporting ATPase
MDSTGENPVRVIKNGRIVLMKNGVSVEEIREGFERVFEIPFESEKRYMVTGYRKDDELIFYIKGDPDVVLKMCRKYMGIDGKILDF